MDEKKDKILARAVDLYDEKIASCLENHSETEIPSFWTKTMNPAEFLTIIQCYECWMDGLRMF
ncbi:hypothetical protein C1645_818276 [Glomus cerebriforme]|uniref:Uncharacterized protein n=1 Tax=Glomus cerebriforme TaxID=658196 RepID=A0A397T8S1_9GLOM|nr:hypothetical protein C1645_818276 [Glomus cerebriforme]